MRNWHKGGRTRRRQSDPCWLTLSFSSLHFFDAFFFGYGRTGRGEAPAGAGVDAAEGSRCGVSGCSKSPKQGSKLAYVFLATGRIAFAPFLTWSEKN
ncbi:hypothetical protein CGRA01v4_13792 [Colletotrichum graminicola]|nr:hypothetical protein CGRA01v4_13792 [Colletotrichum graminicola]